MSSIELITDDYYINHPVVSIMSTGDFGEPVELGNFEISSIPIKLLFKCDCFMVFTKGHIYYKGKLYNLVIKEGGAEPGFSIVEINVGREVVAERITYIEHMVPFPENPNKIYIFPIIDTDGMNGIITGQYDENTATLITFDDETIQATSMTDEFISRISSLVSMEEIAAIHHSNIYWVGSENQSGIINLNTGDKSEPFFYNIKIKYDLYNPYSHLKFAD